ncbi:hypothetical protein DJ019_02040 [Phenylobacterium kunshanense]|uniref:Uncharacterized protein n=1 Tax=Phenylobacterium kunshanense TaxID=1445034 RepID=A0A328BP57_9CAUL|nr:hypothetical protein DJ019_02040 [Phenylobacterium kunshanense]
MPPVIEQNPRKALLLATAAWTQLHGLTQAYQAAVMRGDQRGAEAIRQQAHALLDSNLDLNAEAATITRAMLGG